MQNLGTGGDRGTANIHYFMAQIPGLSRVYGALDMNLLRLKVKGIDVYMV